MKINVIFRSKKLNRFSIENVFNTVVKELEETQNVEKSYVPEPTNSIINMLKNMYSAIKFKGDIFHITGDVHYIALLLKSKRTVLTIHDLVTLRNSKGIKRLLFKFIWFDIPIRHSKIVTVISQKTALELSKAIPHAGSKIRVVYNPVSSDYVFIEKEFNEKSPTILQIGTGQNKNLENVIRAIENTSCKLDIIGRLSDSQKEMLKKYNISYMHSFDLTDEQVKQKYIDCDIVLFASTYEGFGLPIIEAQATGRVVITSDIAPMNEVAANGACYVNPYDVNSIKSAVIKVSQDLNYRNSLIEAGKKNVERFTQKKIAKDYLSVYKEVLSEKKRL